MFVLEDVLALSREQKNRFVDDLSKKFKDAEAVLVGDYRGVDVSSMTRFRDDARKNGVHVRVLKNTLAKRALKGSEFEILSDKLSGPNAYLISQDPIAASKVMAGFSKIEDKFVIKSGAMSGQLLSSEEIKTLSSMPSKEELVAKLLGTLQAPISNFVRTLNEIPTKFVRVLSATRDKMDETN